MVILVGEQNTERVNLLHLVVLVVRGSKQHLHLIFQLTNRGFERRLNRFHQLCDKNHFTNLHELYKKISEITDFSLLVLALLVLFLSAIFSLLRACY